MISIFEQYFYFADNGERLPVLEVFFQIYHALPCSVVHLIIICFQNCSIIQDWIFCMEFYWIYQIIHKLHNLSINHITLWSYNIYSLLSLILHIQLVCYQSLLVTLYYCSFWFDWIGVMPLSLEIWSPEFEFVNISNISLLISQGSPYSYFT